MFALTPGNVFWPYFTGVAILVIGLAASRKELALARGQERIVALGRLFFAAPMALFASQHFTNTKVVSSLVPAWLPGHIFWTYFVGTSIVAAAVGIAAKKQARLAATLLGAMLMVFVLSLWIPQISAHPKSVVAWAFGFRDLAFCGGALAFAGTQEAKWRAEGKSGLIAVARIFVSAAVIFFGAAHFVHPEFLPALDLDQLTPTWIPGRALWPYVAGAVYIVAGTSMVLGQKTRWAATCLSYMVFLLLLFVFLPMVVSKPTDIDNSVNYFASTLAFSGIALLLAGAVQERG
jgi:uncharacterized membrane protein YphA (DoxX/SURF4 family)